MSEQLKAYAPLQERLNLQQGLPFSANWSASSDFLELIVEHALSAKPKTLMECSSGLTSLMLARCCQLNNQGKVYSLEDGEEYVAKTRDYIERYGLDACASIIHAPLVMQLVNGRDYLWYSMERIPESSIDMLVIDGPSGFLQKHSRYPALPLLFDRLAKHGVIFLDDAARQDEQEIVERWLTEYPNIEHSYIETERGCSVLRVNPAVA